MYTMPHFNGEDRQNPPPLPEGYDGTMLQSEPPLPTEPVFRPARPEPKEPPREVKFSPPDAPPPPPPPPPPRPDHAPPKKGLFDWFGSLIGGVPSLSRLGDLFDRGQDRRLRLGTEELLLLGIAAFLFFSKDGDKTCAIFLLFLLLFT